MEKHTVHHFRENWFPKLLSRGNHDQWVTAGRLSLGDRANQRVHQILHEHKPEPLPQEVAVELGKMEARWWSEVAQQRQLSITEFQKN